MIDMVSLFTLQKPGLSLNGAYNVVQPIDKSTGLGRLFYVKNPQGYPIDLRLYDKDFIYDSLTEFDKEGWKNPGYVKLHLGNGGKGNIICPRNVSGLPYGDMITYESLYVGLKDNKWDFNPANVGVVNFSMGPPSRLEWGGDVGRRDTYILCYQWGGASISTPFPNRELYYYAPPFGLVKWTHEMLNTQGDYIIVEEPPIMNKLQPLSTPKVMLPFMR